METKIRSDRITRVIEVQRLDDGDLSEEEAREIADRRLNESINQVRWYFTGTQRVNGNRVQVIYDR